MNSWSFSGLRDLCRIQQKHNNSVCKELALVVSVLCCSGCVAGGGDGQSVLHGGNYRLVPRHRGCGRNDGRNAGHFSGNHRFLNPGWTHMTDNITLSSSFRVTLQSVGSGQSVEVPLSHHIVKKVQTKAS